jgi:sulfite reductase (ferredoxin)
VHRQKDGNFYIGVAPVVGRVSGGSLTKVAEVVAAHGSNRIRTTAQQKLIILDVEEARVDSLVSDLDALGFQAKPSPWRRNVMACTGIEFCKLAIVETKGRAAQLVTELEERVPELDVPITVNVNGCPNSCARIQVADIGLKGQLVVDADGNQVEGYQVHLGGGLGLDAGFGRKLRGHKVTSAGLADYVEHLTRAYLDQRSDGERFAQWVVRADEGVLR